MKKALPIVMLGAALGSAAVFAACGSSAGSNTTTQASTSAAETTTASETTAETPVVGGWIVNTDTEPHVSADDEALFKKAAESGNDPGLKPVACVATQVVAGTNHAFLCTDYDLAWKMVTVYEDLQGNAKIIGTFGINPSDIETTDETESPDIVGGWTVSEDNGGILPDDAQKAFDDALKEYTGTSLKPIALLATQLVSGTNYRVLCNGTAVTPDAKPSLYVADIYSDLNGHSQISDVRNLKLTSYAGSN